MSFLLWQVQIVTVAEARDLLLNILEEAKSRSRCGASSDDERSSVTASVTGTKPKRARKKPNKKAATPQPLMSADSPRGRPESGDSAGATSHQKDSSHSSGESAYSEEILLSMTHQYIEFQYAQRFMSELLTPAYAHFDTKYV